MPTVHRRVMHARPDPLLSKQGQECIRIRVCNCNGEGKFGGKPIFRIFYKVHCTCILLTM